MISCENISKHFPGRKKNKILALDHVNLQIDETAITGIVGNSGCGKSTLARIIVGLMPPSSGKINYQKINPSEILLIFQQPISALNPKHSIEYSLMQVINLNKKADRTEMLDLFQQFSLGEELLQRYPHQISGGEAQRICIVRALLNKPKLLVMDEAYSMLDALSKNMILSVLIKLKKQYQYGMLMISHDIAFLKQHCEKIILISQGKIVEILDQPLSNTFNSPLGKEMMENVEFFSVFKS